MCIAAAKLHRAVIILAVLLSAPALHAAEDNDPWEPMNTGIFTFNQLMDGYLIRPVAKAYEEHMPAPAQRGVHNFLSNLHDFNVLANNLLQLKLRDAASDSGRILINTTVGVAGLMDVASRAGLEKHNEDFGQTLGTWGVGPGPYLVLPMLGPSTVRDAFGLGIDTAASPMQWPSDANERNALHLMDQLNQRVRALDLDRMMSGNEYLFTREAYLQQREYEVTDGEIENDWEWD